MREAEEPAAKPLVPPRPNLGPEPWSEPGPPFGAIGIVGAVLLAGVVAAWIGRKRQKSPENRPKSAGVAEPEAPTNDRERLIAWDGAVRRRLVERFGPAWASRTTEEIAGAPDLHVLLGEDAGRLLDFLKDADLAKFSGSGAEPAEDWAPWVEGFVSAGSIPKRNGP